jgi:hypothetical protein
MNVLPNDTIEHWLLNLAIEAPVWFGLIFPTVESEALNVKYTPLYRTTDYAATLLSLFESNMIAVSSSEPSDDVTSLAGISQILDRFLRLSEDDSALRQNGALLKPYQRNRLTCMQVNYRLTSFGGDAWEKVAEPDWKRILTESRDSTSGDLISPDRDLLIAYMGWYPEINREQIKIETIDWKSHSDFEILYWKRLPFVHHASFGLEPAKPRWAAGEPPWFQEWRCSALSWCKQPR